MTQGSLPGELSYTMGGFLDFSGYTKNSIIASDYGIGRVVVTRRVLTGDGTIFGMDAYSGASFEVGTFRRDQPILPDETLLTSGAVFLGLDTPLIPLYVGAGFAEEGRQNFYIAFGRAFRPRRQ